MQHLGDITKINWFEVEPVDCVTGGSPCQDLSVAGKRAGLAGERSGLYMEQIRCIKELRQRDIQNGRTGAMVRPRWMVWENVPGTFSSNEGRDFAAVLEEAVKIVEPQTPLFLCLTKDGLQQDACLTWTEDGALLGEYTMHSFGECPNAAAESRLSAILEECPHQRYSLSAKACQGILNRAERRGKKLPEQLERVLRAQVDA